MPLENASFINQLEPNNPTVTDGISQGDDHLRLIKTAIKGSFPNFSGSAVQSSEAQLDAGAAVAETGAAKLADAGAFFNTNNTDGVTNPAAGEVDLKAGGQVVLQAKADKSVTVAGALSTGGAASVGGSLSATGPITGPGALPIGGSIIWWSDTLPDASWGTFAWCNGAEYPRSNTALWNVLGAKYGNGDGSTTANLPDLREAVPVGKSQMGGASARGLITQFATATINTLGVLFGEALHKLSVAEAPKGLFSLLFNDPGHTHHYGVDFLAGTGGGAAEVGGSSSQESVTSSTTGITVSLTDHAGDGSHNNMQPGVVCNWVIRTA